MDASFQKKIRDSPAGSGTIGLYYSRDGGSLASNCAVSRSIPLQRDRAPTQRKEKPKPTERQVGSTHNAVGGVAGSDFAKLTRIVLVSFIMSDPMRMRERFFRRDPVGGIAEMDEAGAETGVAEPEGSRAFPARRAAPLEARGPPRPGGHPPRGTSVSVGPARANGDRREHDTPSGGARLVGGPG